MKFRMVRDLNLPICYVLCSAAKSVLVLKLGHNFEFMFDVLTKTKPVVERVKCINNIITTVRL